MLDNNFWQGKKVFITGHTGFKGSWLCLWLHMMGADITGYSLEPPTNPSLFRLAQIDRMINSFTGDIRNGELLAKKLHETRPEIVFHMAAQPLVRESYKKPVETYNINVMGTVNLLNAVRDCKSVRSIVNVTTDKCYENQEWLWGYRENEAMGGFDPYSNSKACSELITASFRSSFFNPDKYQEHGVGLATARAGNVIGGGDWASDRLIPDCLQALLTKKSILIRNPNAIRPWQHVLEPLSGYLLLAQKLYQDGPRYSEGWNFGPNEADAKPVGWIVEWICRNWNAHVSYEIAKGPHPHEANYLKLDCSKAKTLLGWQPRWNLEKALTLIITWTKAYQSGGNIQEVCCSQIKEHTAINN
jgi:CDP-glucose 4,6-dehydratase